MASSRIRMYFVGVEKGKKMLLAKRSVKTWFEGSTTGSTALGSVGLPRGCAFTIRRVQVHWLSWQLAVGKNLERYGQKLSSR
jgi:hypothetical protein